MGDAGAEAGAGGRSVVGFRLSREASPNFVSSFPTSLSLSRLLSLLPPSPTESRGVRSGTTKSSSRERRCLGG